jgi:hypothetical protein
MRRPTDRKPIEWRQLCAVATSVITAAPMIDDAEWKARIKDRVIALEYTYPIDQQAIGRAMSQVEKALERKWGPRPVTEVTERRAVETSVPQEDPPWRGRRRTGTGWTSIAALTTSLRR